jgi:hypothetical protein
METPELATHPDFGTAVERLKRRAETLAQQARQSLNTWIVDAVRASTEPPTTPSAPTIRTGRRLTGWA